MNQENYFEVVGAYLDNELQGEELAQFEKELSGNPSLQKEVSFQKGLIEGIKQNRRTELKARLDNIEIPAGSGSSTLTKTLGGIAVVGMIGLGIYYFSSDSQVTDNNAVESTEIVEQQSQVGDKPSNEMAQEITAEPTTGNERPANETASNQQQPESETLSAQDQADESEDLDLPVAEIPDAEGVEDEMEAMEDIEITTPEISMDKSISSGQSNISVEVLKKRRYNFHYEFNDDRMLLYGDFNQEPYELIEVNLADGKKLFLKYQSKYYAIENTSEITPLKAITDQGLIEKIQNINN